MISLPTIRSPSFPDWERLGSSSRGTRILLYAFLCVFSVLIRCQLTRCVLQRDLPSVQHSPIHTAGCLFIAMRTSWLFDSDGMLDLVREADRQADGAFGFVMEVRPASSFLHPIESWTDEPFGVSPSSSSSCPPANIFTAMIAIENGPTASWRSFPLIQVSAIFVPKRPVDLILLTVTILFYFGTYSHRLQGSREYPALLEADA
jgi:hypothetical protein